MIRTIAALLLLATPAMAQGQLPISGNITGPTMTVSPVESWTIFGGGVAVNGATGEVRIPPGMSPSDAAKQFWNAVAQVRGTPLPFPKETP